MSHLACLRSNCDGSLRADAQDAHLFPAQLSSARLLALTLRRRCLLMARRVISRARDHQVAFRSKRTSNGLAQSKMTPEPHHRALGVEIPPELLFTADEVID
jgi:hypothetical protein